MDLSWSTPTVWAFVAWAFFYVLAQKGEDIMRGIIQLFLSAVLAGFSIGLGGTVFLRVKDAFAGGTVVGALLFAVGLFAVCTRGYALYTGKACYLLDKRPAYIGELLLILLGNLTGCMLLGGLENVTLICDGTGIDRAAEQLVLAKLDSSWLSLFCLGFICNIFIYLAVNGYAKNPHETGKYMALLLGVSCFILAGTEHSVADMYYFCVSGVLYTCPSATLQVLGVVALGNLCGGVFFPLLEKQLL